jgi:hypothetical protein
LAWCNPPHLLPPPPSSSSSSSSLLPPPSSACFKMASANNPSQGNPSIRPLSPAPFLPRNAAHPPRPVPNARHPSLRQETPWPLQLHHPEKPQVSPKMLFAAQFVCSCTRRLIDPIRYEAVQARVNSGPNLAKFERTQVLTALFVCPAAAFVASCQRVCVLRMRLTCQLGSAARKAVRPRRVLCSVSQQVDAGARHA